MRLSLSVSPQVPPQLAPIVVSGDLPAGLRMANQLGYDAVELHIYRFAEVDVDLLGSALAREGLAVSGISPALAFGGDTFSFTSPEPEFRQNALTRLKQQIDFCQRLDTRALVGLLLRRQLSAEPELRRKQLGWMAASMKEADAYAQKRGVGLALEPLNRYETNCFNRCAEVVAFIEEQGLSSCGILLDTFHMNIEEASVVQAIKLAGPLLAYVHLPDSNRWYPGAGHLDLRSVVAALREFGYDGYLAMEVLPLPDPAMAARQAITNARSLLSAARG